ASAAGRGGCRSRGTWSRTDSECAAYPLLFDSNMRMRRGETAMVGAIFVLITALCGCTGGQEGSAAEEQVPRKNPLPAQTAAVQPPPQVDARQELKSISAAIPVYAGAKYRDYLTRRDSVMIKNQDGAGAEVFTLA